MSWPGAPKAPIRAKPDFVANRAGGPPIPERACQLGTDPVTGFRPNEGLGGTRLEERLDRRIDRSNDIDFDFIDPGGLGRVSLKGPLVDTTGRLLPPTAIQGQLDNLVDKALRDAHPASGVDTVAVDLFGLTSDQVEYVKKGVESGLPKPANRIYYIE